MFNQRSKSSDSKRKPSDGPESKKRKNDSSKPTAQKHRPISRKKQNLLILLPFVLKMQPF